MKKNNYSWIFKIGLLSLMIIIVGSSCVKSRPGETNFNGLGPTVLIPEGGMQNFSLDAILFPPTDPVDTTWFHLNYAATNVAPVDEVITIAIDPQALADFNAQGGAQYAIFPDSIFSFTTTTVTVKAGQSYSDAVPLVMFPSKINLLDNYMLPISITAAPVGSTISSNFKTIYYHLIGNPIAGIYNWDWTRWNATDSTGSPTATSFVGHSTVLAPIDALDVTVPSGYYIQPRYIISFTNNGGVLSNFAVSFNPADISTMSSGGVTVSSGPNILIADPINGIYRFQYVATVVSATGTSYRYIIDKFYK